VRNESAKSGVIFENMTVTGFGGAKYWIKTFPDAFNDFFNLWETFRNIFSKRRGTEFDILKDFTGCVRPGEVHINN
jgi:ATP-binding cassette, subfamily G (WHITE), member 2, PDR